MENERIRKYFIWIVENILNNIQGLKLSKEQTKELINNYSGIKVSDMLAWLEKQKEQKPDEYASETMNEKGRIDEGFTKMMIDPIPEEIAKCLPEVVDECIWGR